MGAIVSNSKAYSSTTNTENVSKESANNEKPKNTDSMNPFSSLFSTISTVTTAAFIDPEEVLEKQKFQEKITDFAINHFFYAIPVTSRRKTTVTSLGPIWIEPLPHIVEQSIAGKFSEGTDPLENAPTGILVTGDCGIRIYFALVSLEYYIEPKYAKKIHHMLRSIDPPLVPTPPIVEKFTEHSLYVTWRSSLPYPIGLIDMVEVQYRPIAVKENQSIEELEEELLEMENESSPTQQRKWSALVTRQYHRSNFLEYLFEMLSPGRYYQFRLRYHGINSWSDYSLPSSLYRTVAAVPSKPPSPICTTITSNAVELKWAFPANDNGSKIIEFILVGKSVGYDEFIELYRGLNTSFLAIGLYPEFGYSFKLAVSNRIGISEFSQPVSVQTPVNSAARAVRRHQRKKQTEAGKIKVEENENSMEYLLSKQELYGYTEQQIVMAIRCRHSWHEFWDPKIEKYFYFNTILGYRQLQRPTALIDENEEGDSKSSTTADGSLHTLLSSNPIERLLQPRQKRKDNLQKKGFQQKADPLDMLENNLDFRKKRYQFLRAVDRHRKSTLDALIKSKMPPLPRSSFDNGIARPSISGNTMNNTRNEFTKIDLYRLTILQDFFHCLEPAITGTGRQLITGNINQSPLLVLLKRFKFTFLEEEGIDSGGLSKEAFLLLSKEIVKYVKNDRRKWMDYTKGYKPPLLRKNKPHSYFDDDDDEDVDQDGDATQEDSHVRKKDESYIDGLFFCFDHTSTSTTFTQDIEGKGPSSYLENEFLPPSQLGAILGILIGKAVLDGHLIEFPLSSTLIRYLLGDIQTCFTDPTLIMSTVSNESRTSKEKINNSITILLKELQNLDLELHNSIKWMLENNITSIIDETFTIQKAIPANSSSSSSTAKPSLQTIALCPNGENIPVTEENKIQYIYLILLYKFKYSIQEFIDPLLIQFHQFIPIELLKQFQLTIPEFYLIINGKKTINIEELRAYCIYESITNQHLDEMMQIENRNGNDVEDVFVWNETNRMITWLWRILRECSVENKKLFLQFFTGTTCIPLDGFDPPITIVYGIDMQKNSLPKAHICFHQLVLPYYDSYELMKEKLLFALYNTNSFGFS